ncbi:MAG: hypothetical protein M3418_09310 [Gemmatimonadota bacterium]|nr:hypothetical protein [Gemmatimonadota bacterium]
MATKRAAERARLEALLLERGLGPMAASQAAEALSQDVVEGTDISPATRERIERANARVRRGTGWTAVGGSDAA